MEFNRIMSYITAANYSGNILSLMTYYTAQIIWENKHQRSPRCEVLSVSKRIHTLMFPEDLKKTGISTWSVASLELVTATAHSTFKAIHLKSKTGACCEYLIDKIDNEALGTSKCNRKCRSWDIHVAARIGNQGPAFIRGITMSQKQYTIPFGKITVLK